MGWFKQDTHTHPTKAWHYDTKSYFFTFPIWWLCPPLSPLPFLKHSGLLMLPAHGDTGVPRGSVPVFSTLYFGAVYCHRWVLFLVEY